ncbi:hypothetical protein [uncultured Desulfovibrio sp.]|uniref:hypothetical protein n=1 Tax=uncultured Desulfovibrio sp. TaxID=167968 RepID=UPI0025EEE913|nr:hypothetical protein [uncultured Desulfovibrio sp.]
MKASGGSLMRRCAARLRTVLRDDGERCRQCGVCHNVCGLMGRKPGWLHRAAGTSAAVDAAKRSGAPAAPHSIDAKAQED